MRWRPLPASLDIATDTKSPERIVPVTTTGNNPCRKCLKDGQLGEQMLLLSYDPVLGCSPYSQRGPIFVHHEPACELAQFPSDEGCRVPEQQWTRTLSLRAFDSKHMMTGFDLVEGRNLVAAAGKLLSLDGSEYVHVHYAQLGCFAVRIEKA